jgi:hypothetical protein
MIFASRKLIRGLLMGWLLTTSGCTVVEVKPWQRNILAKPVMAGNPDPALAGIRDHVFFSKEGATGNASAGGGGCGCN